MSDGDSSVPLNADVLAGEGGGQATLLPILNVLLRSRRGILAGALAGALLALVVGLVSDRKWASNSSFMPESRRLPSNISGLAAQFGINVPGGEMGQSPTFYADLATSREILGRLVDQRYRYQADSGAVDGTLVEIYRPKGRTPALRRENAIRELEKHVSATPNTRTGVIRLSVLEKDAELAFLINSRLLALLDEFNRLRRRSQASEERAFAGTQAKNAQQALLVVENRLQQFFTRNRDYRNSPDLTFQQERLASEVSMRQQIYASLTQAAEQAKLEEVRDTPVLTIVESPFHPIRPQSRQFALKIAFGIAFGAASMFVLAVARSGLTRGRAEGVSEVAEFDALRGEAIADMKSPWRLLQR